MKVDLICLDPQNQGSRGLSGNIRNCMWRFPKIMGGYPGILQIITVKSWSFELTLRLHSPESWDERLNPLMWKQCHVKTTHFPGNGVYIYIPPMLQWWLGDGADGIALTKKNGVYLFKSRFFWVKHRSHHFLTHHLRALHSKTLVSHQKTWQFWCYTHLSHFQMHRKIPTACFPSTQSVLCWPRVQPCFSWSNLPIHPGRSWKPSWKSRSVAKRTRPKACGWEGGLGSAVVKSYTSSRDHENVGVGQVIYIYIFIYIYMYNIHIYIPQWIQTLSEKVHT